MTATTSARHRAWNGDTIKALRDQGQDPGLVGTKDLLNPEFEPIEAARYVRDARVVTISPGTVTGHASAGGAFPAGRRLLEPGDFRVF
jgi:homoserine O-acetyltransferase